MKKRSRFKRAIIISAEKDCDDGFMYHDQRWDRNHVTHVIVDFENHTLKVVLKNGDVSETNYKEMYNEDA